RLRCRVRIRESRHKRVRYRNRRRYGCNWLRSFLRLSFDHRSGGSGRRSRWSRRDRGDGSGRCLFRWSLCDGGLRGLSLRRLSLQIGITIDRHLLRGFERVEIRRNIDIEKLSVDLQEPFGVSEAGKLRKIVRLDLSQTRRANFGQARGFIQREASGQSRILK